MAANPEPAAAAAVYEPESSARAVSADLDTLHDRMLSLQSARPAYNPTAPYVEFRRLLVDFICETGESFHLHPSTHHVAVGYLDRVLQNMEVHRTRLQLVAMACLIIAAKYEEAEERVPSADKINKAAKEPYPKGLLHQMEVLVLTRLNWSLTVVTPSHFLGLFHTRGTLFDTDNLAYRPLTRKVPVYLKKYTVFFADLSMQEYVFEQYPPSLLAAAIVLAARKALVVRPLWCPPLEASLRHSEAEVVPLMMELWGHYVSQFESEAGVQEKSASEADKSMVESGAFGGLMPPYYYSKYCADDAAARFPAAALAMPADSAAASPSIEHQDIPLSPPMAVPAMAAAGMGQREVDTPMLNTPEQLGASPLDVRPLSVAPADRARFEPADTEMASASAGAPAINCNVGASAVGVGISVAAGLGRCGAGAGGLPSVVSYASMATASEAASTVTAEIGGPCAGGTSSVMHAVQAGIGGLVFSPLDSGVGGGASHVALQEAKAMSAAHPIAQLVVDTHVATLPIS